MIPLAVLIPVKSLGTKSRLAGVLTKRERREFSEILIAEVLGALRSAGLLRRTYIVSSDVRALELAAEEGVGAIKEDADKGVNAAVLLGIRKLNPGTVLVLPSDLPLLQGAEVRRMLRLKSGLDVSIAPSMGFDGTNALAFSTKRSPDLSYDDDSFWNHIESCGRKGLSVGVASELGIMFDVDSPEDFKKLARTRFGRQSAAFARRVLK